MKKLALLIFLAFNCSYVYSQIDSIGLQKQDSGNATHYIIKTDLLGPLYSLIDDRNEITASLTFEMCFRKYNSFQITGLMVNDNYSELKYSVSHYRERQIIAEYKRFLTQNRIYSGIYSGVYLKYNYHSYSSEYIDNNSNYYYSYNSHHENIGGGLILGYQTYIKKRWVLDFLLGYGFSNRIDAGRINSNTESDGRAALNIGYKFYGDCN